MTKIQTTTRPDFVCPEVWTKIGKAAQNRAKQEWAKRNGSSTMLEDMRGIYFVDPHNEEYKQLLKRKKSEVKTGKTCRVKTRFIGQTERRDPWQPPCGCKAGN